MSGLENLQFSGVDARNIYNRVMQKVETEKGKERVNMLFEYSGCMDDSPAISMEEAANVENTLENQNTGFFGSSTYSDAEIGEVFLDRSEVEFTKELHASLGDLAFVILLTSFRASDLVKYIYSTDLPSTKRIRSIYEELSKLHCVSAKELVDFWNVIVNYHDVGAVYDYKTDRLRADWNMPGIDRDRVIDREFYLTRAILAHAYYCNLDFNRRSKEAEHDTEQSVFDRNTFIQSQALKILGELKRGQEVIVKFIYSGDISWYDGGAAIESAYKALSNFPNQRTIEVLSERIVNGNFESISLAESALVNLENISDVVGLLNEYLQSNDSFLMGEAAHLFRYLWHKEDFSSFRDEVRTQLLDIAINDTDPLVRATAIETLGWAGETAILNIIQEGLANQPGSLPHKIISQALKMAKEKANAAPKSDYEGTVPFATAFFRNPLQTQWIVQKVREKAAKLGKSGENIEILCVGSSFGMEPISILIALMEDYKKNKAAYNGFDVFRRVKIQSTDIDLGVLRYLQRGQFSISAKAFNNELYTFDEYCKEFGINTSALLHKYFNVDKSRQTFSLKSEYQAMLSIDFLDVTDPQSIDASAHHPFLMVYNNVDIYFEPQFQSKIISNLSALNPEYIATVLHANNHQIGTQTGLHKEGYRMLKKSGEATLYENKGN